MGNRFHLSTVSQSEELANDGIVAGISEIQRSGSSLAELGRCMQQKERN